MVWNNIQAYTVYSMYRVYIYDLNKGGLQRLNLLASSLTAITHLVLHIKIKKWFFIFLKSNIFKGMQNFLSVKVFSPTQKMLYELPN